MKLSKLIEKLEKWKDYYDSMKIDPDVVVRTEGFNELDLVDDFCNCFGSTEREDPYFCLFTFKETEE